MTDTSQKAKVSAFDAVNLRVYQLSCTDRESNHEEAV